MEMTSNQDNAGLVHDAIAQGEAQATNSGAISVATGIFTGRSPKDKYIVHEPGSADSIWWGSVNQPMDETRFDDLMAKVADHLAARPVWYQDLAVGAAHRFQYPVQLTTERAWVALFARDMFIVPDDFQSEQAPIWILHAPTFTVDSQRFGTRSSTVIAIHPTKRTIVIAGTEYAGEVKKGVFSLMQFLLPQRGVVTMHCSATLDKRGASTLFFGLSGTGKTTLSNDPGFSLVGDDEHGWSDAGIFNLEGGCYAKVIDLSEAAEPALFAASHRTGAVWENVVIDEAGEPDFRDRSLTENTRAAFPLTSMPNAVASGTGPSPSRIVLLTADASGVLPPVSRLTREQAIGWFLLGFTSKIAGTERGLTAPEMTFSPAFGEPFLMLPPERYAELLLDRIDAHQPALWLVNTGWMKRSADPGKRIPLAHTRAIVHAIVDDSLDQASFEPASLFDLMIPTEVADVPSDLLNPSDSWHDRAEYLAQAQMLGDAFSHQAEKLNVSQKWLTWIGDRPQD